MPLKSYGVLKGAAVDVRAGTGQNPHYQVKVVDNTDVYRIAINVKSKVKPSDLYYLVQDRFAHPILEGLSDLERGFHPLPSRPNALALDYIRGNLFSPELLRPLPFDVPGEDNDLNEKVGRVFDRAIKDADSVVYAFGERWGPEPVRDKIFGFIPGNGVHDIHMNQGNHRNFAGDDGVYQDGGVLVHFPHEQQWVAIFLAFQSQTWHTNDRNGHALPGFRPGMLPSGSGSPIPTPPTEPTLPAGSDGATVVVENSIRIVGAVVNPLGADGGSGASESVTILNTTRTTIDLTGWAIADKAKNFFPLSGAIAAGETRRIELDTTIVLGNKGGIITLLNQGIKVHGVFYTREQAAQEGVTLFFTG